MDVRASYTPSPFGTGGAAVSLTPEGEARKQIDKMLDLAGWIVQDVSATNLHAGPGVAIREFPLEKGHGFADYLLYVDGKAVGVIEAKKEGEPLTGVEIQTGKYSTGLPEELPAHVRPLPFLYQSTGVETHFTNRLDPDPRSRPVYSFHRPETFREWLNAGSLPGLTLPSSLRSRILRMPPLVTTGLWPAQSRAVKNLEESLTQDRPRSLIQMATGSGKTFTAITAAYRLVKFADARRVLFLVDRANLGRQALKEFQQYVTPDDGRKFTELYNVQLLTSNKVDPVARVVITTIQRLYSILRGDPELDPALEEGSQFSTGAGLLDQPVPIQYNRGIPPEFFDVVFIDECHRSIYTLWRQVIEYYDALLIGLTATPGKQTFGFFNQNLVMEYNHEQAVADGVNVDFDVYRILTEITKKGSVIQAGLWIDRRNRETRAVTHQRLDEPFTYSAMNLDRDVVAKDQIRKVVRTFKERLSTEIFPGRTEVPKTLIYAKDDSHAEDIVQVVREEFGRGNDFCQKITYKTTGVKTEDLIASFRNSFNPRIAVTVDMIATGTDIKPLEAVMFLRAVKSRTFFEQMKGRGVRVINPTDLKTVTPDAVAKDHFVIVDCVGACESELSDTFSLDREPNADLAKVFTSLDKAMKQVAFGASGEAIASTLAGKLSRLDRRLSEEQREALRQASGGASLKEITGGIVKALDPDVQIEVARAKLKLPAEVTPPPEAVMETKEEILREALKPLAANPALREKILEVKKRAEQVIDNVSQDKLIEAGFSGDAKENAKTLVGNFEDFIRKHKDEITALQVLYARPHSKRLTFEDVKALADAISTPPRQWTPEVLWRAYETLERDKVKGSSQKRLLTDIVSLVRFALKQEEILEPFPEHVKERFEEWFKGQEAGGRKFTPEQREWLELMRDCVAGSLSIDVEAFDLPPLSQKGGLGKASVVFGKDFTKIITELNGVLVG